MADGDCRLAVPAWDHVLQGKWIRALLLVAQSGLLLAGFAWAGIYRVLGFDRALHRCCRCPMIGNLGTGLLISVAGSSGWFTSGRISHAADL